MKEIGWVNSPRFGAHQHFPAIEHERLLPEPRRPARGRRRKQDIDVAKKRQGLGPEPAAEFLRLRDPGARKHRPGDQPVANVRIEVAKSRAQPLEMKRGAFDHGDQIGGRARLFRAGELDHPVRLQCAGDHIDGGDRARVRRSGRNSRRVWQCEALSRRLSSVGEAGVAGMSACAGSASSRPSIAS